MRKYLTLITFLCWLLPYFTPNAHAGGCSETQSLVRNAIESASSCKANSDCINIDMGCPFGCAVVINKAEAHKLEALKADYPNRCDPCEYKCNHNPSGKILCREKKCVREVE